jgi:S-adenosylmethionine:tRNA ribosyltransferase-isomerase
VLLKDFDFELPKSAIALRPATPRDAARLMVVDPGCAAPLRGNSVNDLPQLIRPGDVMVFNDAKVLPAELRGYRAARAPNSPAVEVSLTLMERLPSGAWRALARPARRLRTGDSVFFRQNATHPALVVAAKDTEGAISVVAGGSGTVEAIMEEFGGMPLPPYIARSRPVDESDRIDYQTVYARTPGAVAAPTAGLHFTPDLLAALAARGVRFAFVTLHVGPGTFLPVKTEDIDGHRMHAERYEISEEAAETINQSRAGGGRVVAVGTTSLRLLETAANKDATISPLRGFTNLFVKPGYRFRLVDLVFTNFHLPKSTLFMLVCAFSGTELMKKAYARAIAEGFRFYSYGDACLLHRDPARPGS